MKIKLVHLLIISTAFALASCSTGVVPMGRDTYMISGMSPGLVNSGAVRAKLLRQADKWCKEKGLVMIPVSYSGQDAVYGQQAANAEVVFRAVPPSDPENMRPKYERTPDHHEMITIQQR